jgi:integral membrane sensor domain MASE1
MRRFPFVRAGLIFAFSPLLIAFVTGLFQGVSMWDEGSGTGAYIWLMLMTLPVGFVLACIGIVMKLDRMRPKLSRGVHKKFPTD